MKKILLIILTLFCISGICSAQERYHWMYSNADYGYFFDTQTLKFGKNNNGDINTAIVSAWIKLVYSDSGRNKYIQSLENRGQDSSNYNDLSYSLIHYVYDINNNKICLLSGVDYSTNGDVIHSYSNSKRTWNDIIPSSNAERWKKALIAYTNEHQDEIQTKSK